MKVVVICKDEISNKKKSLFQSFNIDIIKYTNPLKAMDNFYEISPDIVFFIKDDFPRAWKIVLSSLKENQNCKNSCFILESSTVEDDRKEFNFLNGDILIENNMLLGVKDYISKEFELSFNPTFIPDNNNFHIGFVKPDTFSFISGDIEKLDGSKLIFSVDSNEYEELLPNSSIKNASIELNNEVLSLDFSIEKVENNRYFATILNESEKLTAILCELFV